MPREFQSGKDRAGTRFGAQVQENAPGRPYAPAPKEVT